MTTLRLGDPAPDFEQDSTHGRLRFHDHLGSGWGVLFSHPADFTPVCTTELGYTAKLSAQFAKRNVKVVALSVDPVESHLRWIDDIEDTQDLIPVTVPCGTASCIRTAVGNVGDGERWGGRIETTLQLDDMGIKNGLLKLNVGAQESTAVDPITGVEREISTEAEYDWSVDFRQDIPSWKVAWGGNYSSIGPTPL